MRLTVNDSVRDLDVDPDMPLLWALRDHLGLPGAKYGCGIGLCGACTVHLGGAAVRSCQVPVGSIAPDEPIVTIEGLGGGGGGLHPVQAAWVAEQAPQCGYCQPGQIMQAASLLNDSPDPSDAEIADAMSGNLCRCGAYDAIHAAIRRAAGDPSPVASVRTSRIEATAVETDTVAAQPGTGAPGETVAEPPPVEPFLTSEGFADLPETGPLPAPRGGRAGAQADVEAGARASGRASGRSG